jgi:hypothetical protein
MSYQEQRSRFKDKVEEVPFLLEAQSLGLQYDPKMLAVSHWNSDMLQTQPCREISSCIHWLILKLRVVAI